MASVETVVRQIAAARDRWRILERDVRRCLTKVFPYAILYTIEPDPVLIVAVIHCHREPGYWRGRLQENAEHPVQRTGASRLAQAQIARPRRLAPVADLGVSLL